MTPIIKTAALCLTLAAWTPAVPASAQDAPAKKERRICRETAVTASHIRAPRLCRTKTEWDEIEQDRERQREAQGQVVNPEKITGAPMGTITTPEP